MEKPKDFDQVQEYSQIPALPAGGYVCGIVGVQETTAKSSGAPMIKIALDIAEGEYSEYFRKKFEADSRPDKKWPCVVYQLTKDPTTGGTNRGFKTFTTCVEKSNPGFSVLWGDKFEGCFKNKLIGGVFRREQFVGNNGDYLFSTKCAWFRSVEEIRKGVKIPADKLLDGYIDKTFDANAAHANNSGNFPANAAAIDLSQFEEIIPDGKLPF